MEVLAGFWASNGGSLHCFFSILSSRIAFFFLFFFLFGLIFSQRIFLMVHVLFVALLFSPL